MVIAVSCRPQDGNYTSNSNSNRIFDVRVSTLPGQFGEKLVLRLLAQTPVQHKLAALGFFKNDLKMLYQASQAPSGLILMVGTNGSGKTTTLYAILNALNSQEKNILTIENPVEYHIEGIRFSQTGTRFGFCGYTKSGTASGSGCSVDRRNKR